ncbi:MAG: trypsin-like peptidase domain-containing protein [Fimbriiglobus sp.]|nr:trypsin-like peptidase domain-containing protein [Fimbriiglobus sp.]
MLEADLGLACPPDYHPAPARFWTHRRQVKAAPVPMPAVTPEQHAAMLGELETHLHRPAFAPPAAVSTTARVTAPVNDPAAPPFAAVLKMFMVFGGGLSVGSAFVIGRRAVLTAGHCVYADGRWANNIQFVPRYESGRKPLGTFAAVSTTTLREFTQLPPGPRYVYDLAACVVDKDFPDELVPAAYSVNTILPAGQLRSVGYPAEPSRAFPFDGERMWASAGDYHAEDDPGRGTTAPRVFAHFNDLTGGCSGGPIFDGGNRAVGLNSHVRVLRNGRREEPPRMFSPYFGDALTRLVRWLEANGGRPNPPHTPVAPPDDPPSLRAEFRRVADRLNELIGKL